MTENSKEGEFSHNLDAIIKKLTYSDLISVFFLLMEIMDGMDSRQYLRIKESESEMRIKLKDFFLRQRTSSANTLLIEILFTIKRYDLMKILNVCSHKYQDQCSSLSMEWKCLYEVCESLNIEKDLKLLENIFPKLPTSEDYLEVLFVEAYNAQRITKSSLPNLLTELNEDNIKSRTWHLYGERYFIRQPTKSSPCGLAVIINHTNFKREDNDDPELTSRNDSLLDVYALEKLWKSFGFETDIHLNFKEAEVKQLFQELSEKDFSSYDVFVTCYMSHGKEGVVYSSDCKSIDISCLINFMANECKSLLHKPKLFFIQACQGTQIQCGIPGPVFPPQPQTISSSSPPQPSNSRFAKYQSKLPLYSDVLLAISNIPGFASFACKNKNSWFIEALVKNLEQFGDQKSISEIMTKVTNYVKDKNGICKIQGEYILNCKQTIKTETTFTKSLFLRKVSS